jgi:sec-independent protein translocase protein TatB
MFNIGAGELAIILIVALVFVGPDDLPKVARWLAKALKYLRKTIRDVMATMNLDEDIREVKEAGDMLKDTIHDINPVSGITDEINALKREAKDAVKPIEELSSMMDDINNKDKTPSSGAEKSSSKKEGAA